jgi:DNA polymerase III alpha subunit (gram-positive type)
MRTFNGGTMKYCLYVTDTETTGLDSHLNDIIELSMWRSSDDSQKTWYIKPINFASIELDALRINHHKLEDIKHETKFGKETYLDTAKTIIEIENWVNEDCFASSNRILVGQNIGFDKAMLEQLWIKCNSKDTYPFGYRTMDTMMIEFFLDFAKDSEDMADSYSLSAIIKKYGIKNDKAHTAESDVKATKELFYKQIEFFKEKLK